jgi:hypothetical protein
MIGISACSRLISVPRYLSIDEKLLAGVLPVDLLGSVKGGAVPLVSDCPSEVIFAMSS